ncbi:proto-oncogene tyrosine-protein kinase receptor Ret [Bacillus rossius redtenbacheri]|uniref:proto-oncogene tyrosine-protein kinase receptor Ret n=1 Tax=Bacillus rossius redtenbacheri TaxID=93214 RepID=UPI002FDF03DF
MKVSVVLKDAADSDKDVSALCFWQHAEYSVFENRPATVLGPLGPAFYSLDATQLNYTLLNGSQYAGVELLPGSQGWTLSTRPDLDRDSLSPGPQLRLRVACSAPGGGRSAEATLTVSIRDEDDNPPAAQEPGQLDVGIRAGSLSKGEELSANVVLVDADTVRANTFQALLEGDQAGLLELLPPTEFEDDSGIVPRTALHIKLRAAANASLPSSPYSVKVKVTDTSMVPRHNVANHAEVSLRLRREDAAPRRAGGGGSRRERPAPAPDYPPRVWLYRGASAYSRVATPRHPAGASFSLAQGGQLFGVTPRGGILYVARVEALQAAPPAVTVQVRAEQPGRPAALLQLEVQLLGEAAGPCQLAHGSASDWSREYCSEQRRASACARTCGFASAAGQRSPARYQAGCQWRTSRRGQAGYATCSPSLDTCPDGTCDALEKMQRNICPQDCNSSRFFDSDRLLSGQPGYLSGDIACWCEADGTCLCLPQEPDGLAKRPTAAPAAAAASETPTPPPGAARIRQAGAAVRPVQCGADCVVGVTAACLLVVLSAAGACVLWRLRCVGRARRARKCPAGPMTAASGARADYLEGARQPLDGLLSPFDPSLPLSPADPRAAPDPKWEFPRARLVVEQTLGEGEFGRVLRARALDIGGRPGYTTVAVKTLKEGASSPELADLLSEYQLLKDVSHPNVIRLLGACTGPGAPVYLIIEFAEHGSLRNYLRRSRHVESEGKIPNSFGPSDANPSANHAEQLSTTPRDILSFAWQISKGMAYLSEIKLVHRDLAARNVLVAAGRICKISDFGLTRDVYEDDAYLKRSKGRVPVKWMAVESLADHVYTSKSDVWSFGVLLWELVTLGASPYPGVAVHNLFHLLRAGYRMERPENCSAQLYRVMRSCWQGEPGSRPSFKELVMLLERMLEDGVEYLDLNPRVVHNRAYFSSPAGDQLPADGDEEDDVRYGNLSLLRSESTTPLVAAEAGPRGRLGSVPEEENTPGATPRADQARLLRYQNQDAAYLSPVRRPSPAYVSMTGSPAAAAVVAAGPTSQTHF